MPLPRFVPLSLRSVCLVMILGGGGSGSSHHNCVCVGISLLSLASCLAFLSWLVALPAPGSESLLEWMRKYVTMKVRLISNGNGNYTVTTVVLFHPEFFQLTYDPPAWSVMAIYQRCVSVQPLVPKAPPPPPSCLPSFHPNVAPTNMACAPGGILAACRPECPPPHQSQVP